MEEAIFRFTKDEDEKKFKNYIKECDMYSYSNGNGFVHVPGINQHDEQAQDLEEWIDNNLKHNTTTGSKQIKVEYQCGDYILDSSKMSLLTAEEYWELLGEGTIVSIREDFNSNNGVDTVIKEILEVPAYIHNVINIHSAEYSFDDTVSEVKYFIDLEDDILYEIKKVEDKIYTVTTYNIENDNISEYEVCKKEVREETKEFNYNGNVIKIIVMSSPNDKKHIHWDDIANTFEVIFNKIN